MKNVDLEGLDFMSNEVFSWSKEQLMRFRKPHGRLKDIGEPKSVKSVQKQNLMSPEASLLKNGLYNENC